MADIIPIIGGKKPPEKPENIDRTYEIVVADNKGEETLHEAEGYLVVTPLILGVCRGEGEVQFAVPFESVVYARVKASA